MLRGVGSANWWLPAYFSLAVPSHVAICPFIHVQKVSNLNQCYDTWSTLWVGFLRLGVCQSMPKGFISPSIIYRLFDLYLFKWILIGKKNYTFWKNFKLTFIGRKHLCYKKEDHFRASPVWCSYFEFFEHVELEKSFWELRWRTSTRIWARFFFSQLSVYTLLPLGPTPLYERPQEEGGYSRPFKQLRIK